MRGLRGCNAVVCCQQLRAPGVQDDDGISQARRDASSVVCVATRSQIETSRYRRVGQQKRFCTSPLPGLFRPVVRFVVDLRERRSNSEALRDKIDVFKKNDGKRKEKDMRLYFDHVSLSRDYPVSPLPQQSRSSKFSK